MNKPTTGKDLEQYLCIPIKFDSNVLQTWSVKIPMPRLPCLRGQSAAKKNPLPPSSAAISSGFHASEQEKKCQGTPLAPAGNTAQTWTMWRIAAREHRENRHQYTLASSAQTPPIPLSYEDESTESARSNSVPRSFPRTDHDKTPDNVRLSLESADSELDRQRKCGSPESGIDCDEATSPSQFVPEGWITEEKEPFLDIGANLEVGKSKHLTTKSSGRKFSKSRFNRGKVSETCSTDNTNAVAGNSTADADLPVAHVKNFGASKPSRDKDVLVAPADTKMAVVGSTRSPTEASKRIFRKTLSARAARGLCGRNFDAHAVTERDRRMAMRASFVALLNVLPQLKYDGKTPKVRILVKARELCILLRKVENTLLIEKARLSDHKECLLQRLRDHGVVVDGSGDNKPPASPTSVPSPTWQDHGKSERLVELSQTDHSYSSPPRTTEVPSRVATPLKCTIADVIDKVKPNPQSQLSSFRKPEGHVNVLPPNLRTEEEVDVVGLDEVVNARDLLKQGCSRWTEENADSYDIADDLCIVSVHSLAPQKSAAGKNIYRPKGSDESLSLPNCSRLCVRKEKSPKHGLKRVLVVDANYACAEPLPRYILEALPEKKCHLDLNIDEPLPCTSRIPHRQKQYPNKPRIRPRGIAQMKLSPRVGLSFRKPARVGLSFRKHIGGRKHFSQRVYQHRERTPLQVERVTNDPTVKVPEGKEVDFSQDEEFKSRSLVAEEAGNQMCNGDDEAVVEGVVVEEVDCEPPYDREAGVEGVVVEEVDCEPPYPYSDADLVANDEGSLASDPTLSVDAGGLDSASNVQTSPFHGSLSADERERLDLVDGTGGVGPDVDSDSIRFNFDWQVDANSGGNDSYSEMFEPIAELKKNVGGENEAVAFGNCCENISVSEIPAERHSEAAMTESTIKPSEEVLLSADAFDVKNKLSRSYEFEHSVDMKSFRAVGKKEEFLRCGDVSPVVSLERIVIPLGTRMAPDFGNDQEDEVFDFDETGHFYESPPEPHTRAIPSDVNNVSGTVIARKETAFVDSRLGSSPMDRISELRKKLRQKEADLEKVRENLISLTDVPLE